LALGKLVVPSGRPAVGIDGRAVMISSRDFAVLGKLPEWPVTPPVKEVVSFSSCESRRTPESELFECRLG
jgi:hypothetical protein